MIILGEQFPNGYFWLISNSRSGHNFIKNNIESWFDKTRMYWNLEQFSPKAFNNHETLEGLPAKLYDSSLKVVCTRDLLNWFTSCSFMGDKFKDSWKGPWTIKEGLEWRTRNWIEIAKETLGITNYIKDSIGVYYDDFVSSEKYRKNICDKLGGEYNEKMLNIIPQEGNHSTFDGAEFQNRAQEMKVLERYKVWENKEDKKLLRILKNSEALDFYLKHFDVDNDKMKFIEKWIMSK